MFMVYLSYIYNIFIVCCGLGEGRVCIVLFFVGYCLRIIQIVWNVALVRIFGLMIEWAWRAVSLLKRIVSLFLLNW